MKSKMLLMLTALVLALCFTLAACGDNNGASPDSATADESATGDSRVVSSSGASSGSASSASSEDADDESSSGSASSSAAVTPQQNNEAKNDADNGDNEQEADSKQEKSNQSSSKQASSKSDSSKSSSVAPNPAYSDGHRPNFTIVLTNKSTKQSYSAACSYTKDDDNLAYASFFLPGGDYDIAVYEYADKIDKSNPLVTWSYNNDIDAKKKKSIRVSYYADEKKIEVKENPSSQAKK